MRPLALVAALALSACWVNSDDYWVEANFEDEYDAAFCDWMLGCFGSSSGWNTEDECLEAQATGEQDLSRCTYDPKNAQQCVKEWWNLPCRAWDNGDFPEVCDVVYDCPTE